LTPDDRGSHTTGCDLNGIHSRTRFIREPAFEAWIEHRCAPAREWARHRSPLLSRRPVAFGVLSWSGFRNCPWLVCSWLPALPSARMRQAQSASCGIGAYPHSSLRERRICQGPGAELSVRSRRICRSDRSHPLTATSGRDSRCEWSPRASPNSTTAPTGRRPSARPTGGGADATKPPDECRLFPRSTAVSLANRVQERIAGHAPRAGGAAASRRKRPIDRREQAEHLGSGQLGFELLQRLEAKGLVAGSVTSVTSAGPRLLTDRARRRLESRQVLAPISSPRSWRT